MMSGTETKKAIIIDNLDISQTVSSQYIEHNFAGSSFEDDCGRTLESFGQIGYYSTSLNPIKFETVIFGDYDNNYSFSLKSTYGNHKTITYSFITNSVVETNAEAEILKDLQLGSTIYTEVMHFKFLSKLNPNELKELFYAKGVGIVKFSTENGNEFIVQ